jgi:hypothetical protein
VHEAVGGGAVARQPDEGAPNGQAGHEGAGAVDGVEDPDVFGVGLLLAELLADDAVRREGAFDELPHGGLAGPVGLGDGIEGPAAGLVAGREGGAEEGQYRLAGQVGELVDELREIDEPHIVPA